MKLNSVSFENFPEPGELVWFSQDSSGGVLIADKGWIPAIWLGVPGGGYLDRLGRSSCASVLMKGEVRNNCHISRFHRGDSPPLWTGDEWK